MASTGTAGRRYETLVLIHPEQGEQGARDLTARIRTLIEEQRGVISQVLEWGMRDLAYPIAKQRRALYVLFEYRADVAGLREIERNITLTDAVLRFISVQQAENAPPATLRHVRTSEVEVAEAEEAGAEFEQAEGEGA
jgi:small subunit ribosomal protein S6